MTELAKAIWTNPLVAIEFAMAAVYFAMAVAEWRQWDRMHRSGSWLTAILAAGIAAYSALGGT